MKKVLSILILLSMLLGAAAGCAESADKGTDDGEQTQAVTDAETEDPGPQLDLEMRDLDGFTITFITKSTGAFAARDVGVEEQTGDGYNDAVYARDMKIEETYKCNIECVFDSSEAPVATARKTIQANDDYYDVIYDGLGNIFGLAQEKMALDFNTLSYIDFSKPWWDAETNNALTINGKLCGTYGEHMIGPKSGLYCLFFNKKLVEDLNLTEPYDLVREGTWTMDAFADMAKTGNFDLNGDGKMTGEDRFGHITEGYSGYTFMISQDYRIGYVDESGLPAITPFDDSFYAKAEKAAMVLSDKDITYNVADVRGVTDMWGAFWTGAFINNQFLFREGAMHDTPQLRIMDAPFGIVPIPKFDEKQQKYLTTNSIVNAQMMCIPVSASSPDDVAYVLEAMAYYSTSILTPVYYNVVLQGKTFRDDDSEEMLDIIFAGKVFDIGCALDVASLRDSISNDIWAGGGKLASNLAKKEKNINRSIEKIIEKFAEE